MYSNCVSIVVIFILHGKRMHPMILSRHLFPLWLYHIFPHYHRNGTIFWRKKNYWTWSICFDFPYKSVWNIFHYTKDSATYYNKCTQDFVWSTRCSLQILIKIELFGQTSKNLQISNLNENPSSGSRVVPCRQRDKRQTDGQTETHDEANRRFSQFCERV